MAAISKHYGDVYRWIERIIDSCTHPLQETTVRKLITQFRNNLRENGEVDTDTIHFMEDTLRFKLDQKTYKQREKTLLKD